MKSTSNSVRQHLDSEVTALCTCWKIIRQDGKTLLFTDADTDLTIDGEVYLSIGAYSRTAIESTAQLAVDNLDVAGIATPLVLPLEELRAGAFDHAEVYIFLTPWINPSFGKVKLRKGFFGEVRVLPNGTFDVELRGLLQKLAHNYMEVFSATCRNDLGDARCGVQLYHPFTSRGATLALPLRDSDFEELGSRGANATAGWYDPTASGEIMTVTAPTNTGSYAARGGVDGFLQQDLDLTKMGPDFIDHVEEEKVTFRLHGWRRDNGARGRVRAQFFDDAGKTVRQSTYLSAPDTYLRLPETMRLPGDFTVEFWIRTRETSATGQCLIAGTYEIIEGADTNIYSLEIRNGAGSDDRRRLYLDQQRRGTNNSLWNDTITNMNNVTHYDDRQWHHVALVRRGGTIELYVDAVLSGEADMSPIYSGKEWGLQFFGGKSGSTTTIAADWDDIRVWDHAREQWQIAAFRFSDLPAGQAGLRAYYPFENGTVNEGYAALGNISTNAGFGTSVSVGAPVKSTHRGNSFDVGTGFQNVGSNWVLTTLTGFVPPRARTMRLIFDAQADGGSPTGALLDSLFGYFLDADSAHTVPNLDESGSHWKRAGMVVSGGGNRIFRASINEPRAIDGWFNGGLVTFYTGKNAGGSMEVKTWYNATGQIELYLSMPYPIEPGDIFTVYPGCDKSRICCTLLFNNIENMFATPDVPGEDELFRYPDAK
ncbi:minor tail protein [Rhodobacter phage RcXuper]|nr:minor tail protein [Rhodobacter phage RcXuper]